MRALGLALRMIAFTSALETGRNLFREHPRRKSQEMLTNIERTQINKKEINSTGFHMNNLHSLNESSHDFITQHW